MGSELNKIPCLVSRISHKAFAISIATALLVGCGRSAPKSFDEMSSEEQMNYCRAQTAEAIRECCTNSVPGIHAFVSVFADDSNDAIVKWKGQAEFDYINSVGGINRTNLHVIFKRSSFGSGRIYCLLDEGYYEQQWKEKQARILRGENN